MNIINYTLDNGLLFWGYGTCILGIMTWSLFSSFNIPVQTFSKGTMTSPISEGTITPRTFNLTREQLTEIQTHLDQAVQYSPKLDDVFTPISEKGIQAVVEKVDSIIQTKPELNIETQILYIPENALQTSESLSKKY